MVRFDHIRYLGLMAALALAGPAARAEGDPARGAEVIRDSERGNCTICHAIPGLGIPDEAQGDIGPPLAGIGAMRDIDELRAIVTDPRGFFPRTIMPAYGVTEGLVDVAELFRGRPILNPQEIADVAAYLESLR